MAKTYNKGEWSELYAFAKILSERKVHAADENVKKINDLFFPVKRIIRPEDKQKKVFSLTGSNTVEIQFGEENKKAIGTDQFETLIPQILSEIKIGKGNSFESPTAEKFMNILDCKKVKADSANKADITLVIHDIITQQESEVGFSIKSELGGTPTLFNASGSTNFIYEVSGFSGDLKEVNSIQDRRNKVQKRVRRIKDCGGTLKFIGMQSHVFEKNLRKNDSLMPIIMSEFLKVYYEGQASSISDITRIVSDSKTIHDLKLNFDSDDIKFKIKYLLLNMALGMVSATLWDGFIKADGGYLIVKEDGDVLCYHIYNVSQFSEYLYHTTKLDTPSVTKMKYASLYQEEGKLFFKLNLQVRFI